MSRSIRDLARQAFGDELPVVRATSAHLSGVFPFQAEGGLIDPRTGKKLAGVPVGSCGRDDSGGSFDYDLFAILQAGLAKSLNEQTYGNINHHKSGDKKTYIERAYPFGYNFLVTDVKDEYLGLAARIPGSRVMRFGKDANLFINALDNAMSLKTQAKLVRALGLTVMPGRTELDSVERSLVWHGIQEAHRGRDIALLPHAIELISNPTEAMARSIGESSAELKLLGRQLAVGLRSLNEGGEFGGTYHRETTPGLFEACPLQVISVADLEGTDAALMVIMLNFFSQSEWSSDDPKKRFHHIIHDEFWHLATFPGVVESVRNGFKLGRTKGVANHIVAHYKTNLDHSGNSKAVADLNADCGVTIIYNSNKKELEASAEQLKLTEADVERASVLPPGVALYKIGDLPTIEVRSYAWPEEETMVETSHLAKGQEKPQYAM
jgi:hypothetical protein